MGWLDEEGYLYLGDRLQDMILTGGANVYPAEVEAAIQEHPDVLSVAVIGLPDDDMGNVVHAVIEADPQTISKEDLLSFVAERVARYKVPRSVEYTDHRSGTKPANCAEAPYAPNGPVARSKAEPPFSSQLTVQRRPRRPRRPPATACPR